MTTQPHGIASNALRASECPSYGEDEERFWAKVDRGATDACWCWMAYRNPQGYGRVWWAGRRRLAHRLAWEFEHGPIPAGVCALHRCDNPPCVNPAHLFLGTHADNAADRDSKGRQVAPRGDRSGSRLHPERRPRGEQHGSAILTEAEVREIRSWRTAGFLLRQIGAAYGVSPSTIKAIASRRIWRHVA